MENYENKMPELISYENKMPRLISNVLRVVGIVAAVAGLIIWASEGGVLGFMIFAASVINGVFVLGFAKVIVLLDAIKKNTRTGSNAELSADIEKEMPKL